MSASGLLTEGLGLSQPAWKLLTMGLNIGVVVPVSEATAYLHARTGEPHLRAGTAAAVAAIVTADTDSQSWKG